MRGPARLSVPLLTLALAGCAAPGPTLSERLSTFIGRSEGDLVAEFGVPVRTHQADGRRFLQYEQRRTIVYSEPGYHRPYFGPWGPRWGYWPAPPSYATIGCDITFALRDGLVESFSFRGQGCG